ncbi:hypothetical protein JAAARDRAFT_71725 [Jaapia argillacea MUCL 33604]|uniref:Uncharacterized protein n=1 Tax=Jaapia argillacea MUCL 33604 TaxID=933084 RepID=A0A067PUL3_9AGAM|nr:hypothetical protein JAAARDRAFT_71725 [Jaapia argillacea MUCL 33604]
MVYSLLASSPINDLHALDLIHHHLTSKTAIIPPLSTLEGRGTAVLVMGITGFIRRLSAVFPYLCIRAPLFSDEVILEDHMARNGVDYKRLSSTDTRRMNNGPSV